MILAQRRLDAFAASSQQRVHDVDPRGFYLVSKTLSVELPLVEAELQPSGDLQDRIDL